MALQEKHLFVKRSLIKKAGKGLFTSAPIAKGTRITEYKGTIKTWKEVTDSDYFNAYVFYVNKNHVIDAMEQKDSFARYANDAKGSSGEHAFRNNCKYEIDGLRVYLIAMKDIAAGAEILVGYGKEYWNVMKANEGL